MIYKKKHIESELTKIISKFQNPSSALQKRIIGKNQSYPKGKDIPLSDKEGYTESQFNSRNIQLKTLTPGPVLAKFNGNGTTNINEVQPEFLEQLTREPIMDSLGNPTGKTILKKVKVKNPHFISPAPNVIPTGTLSSLKSGGNINFNITKILSTWNK